jgi:hypothetical protein
MRGRVALETGVVSSLARQPGRLSFACDTGKEPQPGATATR